MWLFRPSPRLSFLRSPLSSLFFIAVTPAPSSVCSHYLARDMFFLFSSSSSKISLFDPSLFFTPIRNLSADTSFFILQLFFFLFSFLLGRFSHIPKAGLFLPMFSFFLGTVARFLFFSSSGSQAMQNRLSPHSVVFLISPSALLDMNPVPLP